jgi:hypothetical protein
MKNTALLYVVNRVSRFCYAHLDVVLRKLIFELQGYSERIHKALMLGI